VCPGDVGRKSRQRKTLKAKWRRANNKARGNAHWTAIDWRNYRARRKAAGKPVRALRARQSAGVQAWNIAANEPNTVIDLDPDLATVIDLDSDPIEQYDQPSVPDPTEPSVPDPIEPADGRAADLASRQAIGEQLADAIADVQAHLRTFSTIRPHPDLLIIHQTDLSVGVLTVLYKGPWMVCGSVARAGEHFSLYSTLFGDTYLQKRFMKLKFKCNFRILVERCCDFWDLTSNCLPDASSASSLPSAFK
jgi:hypothetical protein